MGWQPDAFTFRGVCGFCHEPRQVHNESRLCASCLSLARTGWMPRHMRPGYDVATDTLPGEVPQTKPAPRAVVQMAQPKPRPYFEPRPPRTSAGMSNAELRSHLDVCHKIRCPVCG